MSGIIVAESVRKNFKTGKSEVEVLRGIDLEIQKGEFVSIMGQSGSGKSTLLYLLGALDRPSSGKIYIDGIDISGMSDRQVSRFHRRDLFFSFTIWFPT